MKGLKMNTTDRNIRQQEMIIKAKRQAKEYYITRIEKLEDAIGRKIEF